MVLTSRRSVYFHGVLALAVMGIERSKVLSPALWGIVNAWNCELNDTQRPIQIFSPLSIVI